MLNLETSGTMAAKGEVELPKLVWGAGILAFVNLIVGLSIALAPDLNIGMEGIREEPRGTYVSAKPSPFSQAVNSAPRKVRAAVKLTPVLEYDPTFSSYHQGSDDVILRNVSYTSGADVYRHVEREIGSLPTRTTVIN